MTRLFDLSDNAIISMEKKLKDDGLDKYVSNYSVYPLDVENLTQAEIITKG